MWRILFNLSCASPAWLGMNGWGLCNGLYGGIAITSDRTQSAVERIRSS